MFMLAWIIFKKNTFKSRYLNNMKKEKKNIEALNLMWIMVLDILHVQWSWSYCAPMCPYSSLHSYLKSMHADSSISGLFFQPSLQANIPGNPSKIFMNPWAANSLFTLESGMNDSRILWNSPLNNDILSVIHIYELTLWLTPFLSLSLFSLRPA